MVTQGVPTVSKEERVENVIIAGVAIIIGLVMAVYSWFTLPDYVATQPSFLTTGGAIALPKFVAVLFPLGLTSVMAAAGINHRRQFVLCLFGYVLYILLWMIN